MVPESGIGPLGIQISRLARTLAIGGIAIVSVHGSGGIHDFPDGAEVVAGVVDLVGPLNDALTKESFRDGEVGLQAIAFADDGSADPEVEFLAGDDVVGQLGDFDGA